MEKLKMEVKDRLTYQRMDTSFLHWNREKDGAGISTHVGLVLERCWSHPCKLPNFLHEAASHSWEQRGLGWEWGICRKNRGYELIARARENDLEKLRLLAVLKAQLMLMIMKWHQITWSMILPRDIQMLKVGMKLPGRFLNCLKATGHRKKDTKFTLELK